MKRSLVVMMPFGGDNEAARCHAALMFARIQHIIRRCKVRSRHDGSYIEYLVKPSLSHHGNINGKALREIADADVLVGLITDKNANVMYEVAVRNLLRPELILIVKDPDDLPLYLRDWAYAPLRETEVDTRFDELLKNGARKFPMRRPGDPFPREWKELRTTIDEADVDLRDALQSGLENIERDSPSRQEFVEAVMNELEPWNLANSWTMFYPTSIIEVEWKRKSNPRMYSISDIHGEPRVTSCNATFLQLYNLTSRETHRPGFTRDMLLDGVAGFLENRTEFETDQKQLAEQVIFGDHFGLAKEPLRFNAKHTVPAFRNSAHYPCLVGKKVLGDTARPHRMYLQIVYVSELERTALQSSSAS